MDPNAKLDEQLRIAARILAADTEGAHESTIDDALRLAELVEALDGWIRRGGFLPDAWREKRKGA